MSDEKQVVPEISMLDQLKVQKAQFAAQREIAQSNLNQLIGAIYACDVMIQKHEEEAKKLGDKGNGETDDQDSQEAA